MSAMQNTYPIPIIQYRSFYTNVAAYLKYISVAIIVQKPGNKSLRGEILSIISIRINIC